MTAWKGTPDAVSAAPVNPVGGGFAALGLTPVTGNFTANSQQSASFTPVAGRPFNVSIWGTFSLTVQLERSFDSGTTWLQLTDKGTQIKKFTGSTVISESATENEASGVLYRLSVTAYTSGTASYRLSQ